MRGTEKEKDDEKGTWQVEEGEKESLARVRDRGVRGGKQVTRHR